VYLLFHREQNLEILRINKSPFEILNSFTDSNDSFSTPHYDPSRKEKKKERNRKRKSKSKEKFIAMPDKHHPCPILLRRNSCLLRLGSAQIGSVAVRANSPSRMIAWVGHKVARNNVLHKLESSLAGRSSRKGRNRLHALLGRGGICSLHLVGWLLNLLS
jgi:hypothetical protein